MLKVYSVALSEGIFLSYKGYKRGWFNVSRHLKSKQETSWWDRCHAQVIQYSSRKTSSRSSITSQIRKVHNMQHARATAQLIHFQEWRGKFYGVHLLRISHCWRKHLLNGKELHLLPVLEGKKPFDWKCITFACFSIFLKRLLPSHNVLHSLDKCITLIWGKASGKSQCISFQHAWTVQKDGITFLKWKTGRIYPERV